MALSKEQITQIKFRLRQMKAQQGRFLYCPEGPDGDPVLLLDRKRIAASEIKKLRTSARKKKFIRGFVQSQEDGPGYLFRARGTPPIRFEKDVLLFFARAIPILRGSEVVPLERRAPLGSRERNEDLFGYDAGMAHDELDASTRRADEAAQRQKQLSEQVAQLLAQQDALKEQQVNAAFEAERAMDRFEAAAGSFNPFKRRKARQRRQDAEDAQEERVKLEEGLRGVGADIEAARAQVAAARLEADAARAASDALLARWSDVQESYWTSQQSSPFWLSKAEASVHEHAEASDLAETARNAWAASREALDAASARRAALDKTADLNEEEIAHLEGEIAALAQRESLSLSDVKLQAALQSKLDALRLENVDAAFEHDDLTGAIEQLEAELSELRQERDASQAAAERSRSHRDMLFMSPEERKMAHRLHTDRDGAREAVAAARAAQASCHAEVDALRAGLDGVSAARKAFEAAQAKLFACQIERDHLTSESKLLRVPGMSGRKKRIDTARAALPSAQLAEGKARQAFEAARRALQAAEEAEAPRVGAINEATEAMLIADRHAAEADAALALLDHRVAEEEARVVGWVEDLQRQQLRAQMELTAASSPEFRRAWEDRDAAADVAAEMGEVLLDAEVYLSEIQAEIRAVEDELAEGYNAGTMDNLQELLAELPQARAAIEEARQDALYAEQETAASEGVWDAVVREHAHRDARLQALLDDHDAIKADLAACLARDAAAAGAQRDATAALNEAARRDSVHALHTEVQAFIHGSHSLLETFHHLDKADDVNSTGVIVDLLDDDGRALAREQPEWEQLRAFRKTLNRYALQMLRQGATVDELSRTLEAVPNGLRPDAWRSEVQSFTTLQAALELTEEQREEATVLKAARKVASPDAIKKSIRDKLKAITDTRPVEGIGATEKVDLLTGKVDKILDNPLYSEVPDILEKVEDALGFLGEGLEFVQASEAAGNVGQAKARYSEVTDRFTDALLDLKERGVELFGALKPILDTLKGPVDTLAQDIIHASVRRGQARHTRLLAQAAKVAGSPLVGAFDEAVARENALWARYAVSATMDTLDIAAKLLLLFPDATTAAVSAALQIGAAGVKSNLDIAAAVAVDWETARKAKALLVRAKKGDARARAELTRYHPLYAKGLIAHMAREGDPFATLYVTSRGIDAGRVQQYSSRILAYYLLDDAQQLDEDGELVLETGAEWWQRKSAAWTAKIVGGLKAIKEALLSWRKSEAQRVRERMLSVRRASSEMAEAIVAARRVLSRLEARLAAGEGDADALAEQVGEVRHLLETYRQTFSLARQDAVLGLEVLSRVEREVGVMRPRAVSGGLEPDALAAFEQFDPVLPQLRDGYLEIVEDVTRAA